MNGSSLAILQQCKLFKGLRAQEIEGILADSSSQIEHFQKGELVFMENDVPERLFILLTGRVAITRNTISGRRILITELEKPGEMFAEIYLFLQKKSYDMQAEVEEPTRILSLSRQILKQGRNGKSTAADCLQQNLIQIFAEKTMAMNDRLRVLASGSIREKIARYLLQRQGADGAVRGNLAREDMADYMNVTRPSLSRELGRMQEEGILQISGRQIRIISQEMLESYL